MAILAPGMRLPYLAMLSCGVPALAILPRNRVIEKDRVHGHAGCAWETGNVPPLWERRPGHAENKGTVQCSYCG